ncbi:MAG: TetR family transcriptional regulator [Candidatus Methanoperedenaceae archaeon]|nr:MAG: TetR family transcriptional regulator [Candidatus Methanoperedenaceae archaeon]
MGIKERKLQEKSEMRELIQKTAMNLFLEKGFENITIRHIAEKIEYSPATIYLYFKNKDEILYILRREGFEDLYRRQKDSLKLKDPLKRLLKHGEAYVSFALENPQYYDLMFMMRSPSTRTKEMNDMDIGLQSYELLKNNIKECMEKGLFPGVNIDVAAFSLWSYVHGIASLIIRGRGIMFPEEGINDMIKGALNFLLEVIPDKLDSKKRSMNLSS